MTQAPPKSIDKNSSGIGLRAIAALEATKGVVVLVLILLLLAVHNRIEDYAEDLLYHLHIDFDHHFAQRFLDSASRLSDSPIWMVTIAAILYALLRFVEAWGLWNRRVWAEWFALLSGALYLPLEILKVTERATWEHLALLAANLVIVLYMLSIRIRAARTKRSLEQ